MSDTDEILLKAMESATEIRLIHKLLQEKGGYHEFLAMLDETEKLKGGKR